MNKETVSQTPSRVQGHKVINEQNWPYVNDNKTAFKSLKASEMFIVT